MDRAVDKDEQAQRQVKSYHVRQITYDIIVFFDEFAVYDRPSLFYAWAEKNSRSQVPSNERRRNKVNGLLAVDVETGEEYLRLKERAKTEDISSYFTVFCRDCVQQGLKNLSVILDNNTTHKKKMRNLLELQLAELGIKDKIEVAAFAKYFYSSI